MMPRFTPNRTEPYSLMDRLADVYTNEEMSAASALLAFRLYERSGLNGPIFNISDSELARICFVSRNTIGSQKLILKSLGLITWAQGSVKGSKATNTYDVSGLIEFVEKHRKQNLPNNRASKPNNLPNNRAGTPITLPNDCAAPAQKLGTIENIENKSLSREEDLSGFEAENRFGSAEELWKWVCEQSWGRDLAQRQVNHFFSIVSSKQWMVGGQKILSLKKTLQGWKCPQPDEVALPPAPTFTQFYNI